MAADRTAGARAPGRRDVLRLLGGTLGVAPLALLAACDVRLEDDAPALPLLQRKSVPDEAVLIDAVRRTTALTQSAARVADPPEPVSRLAVLHQTQAQVLRARLTEQGVPNHVIDPPSGDPATAPPNPAPAVSAPPPATAAEVAVAEQALLSALLPALPTVTAANRTVLTSVAAATGAAVELLGTPVTWPAADPLPAPAAVPLLEATRAAEYAFDVVAAQTSGDQRALAMTTHTQLAVRETALTGPAGWSTPAPLGYALPFPVRSPEEAAQLATRVLTTLVAGGLAPLGSVPGGSTALTTLVRLLVEAQRLGRTWGVAPQPFPGLAYP